MVRRHNDSAWAVWHVAALARAKQLPKLDRLRLREPHKQTWQQMREIARLWVIAMGGKIITGAG